MPLSGKQHRVALVRTDVLEQQMACTIRTERLSELGITLAVITKATRITFQKAAFFIVTTKKSSNINTYIFYVK
jgi:hypothetical protein